MNTVITSGIPNASLTMSSREIAELTGSTHDNVLKTIRSLIKKGVVSGNETPYIHPQNGQTYKEFHLDYRNTMVVTSGYSVELRAKIIDRWMELEAAPKVTTPIIPKTYAEALLEAGRMAQQLEIAEERSKLQQAELEAVKPKVAALTAISEAKGDLGIRDAGRVVEVGMNRVKEEMFARKWACKEGRKIRPAHYGLTNKYCRLVERIYTDKRTGETCVSEGFKVTHKGIVRLSEIFHGKNSDITIRLRGKRERMNDADVARAIINSAQAFPEVGHPNPQRREFLRNAAVAISQVWDDIGGNTELITIR
ncbi:phage regulatory protein/antirepressor Ant [Acetobacter senegalensis]|uniref:Rha family transcriptional regulator n=1 Tax=Acetobacter senegalensis TaxID=446692 RepID=UPI001EDA487E|nr:Rha family transcriptional regulator [Acetobacter senegalensis]MCG4261355.1 phage regulatory protein/antirepressor Ant [Acetobacter senegalensis]